MSHKEFYELSIWKNGYTLLMSVYDCIEVFPYKERFALADQLCRSANSIIANIAESSGRYSYADKVRVLYISRGEISETRSHLSVALGRKYISKETFSKLNDVYKQLIKELNLYINTLSKYK